jgi:hypothetical protein
MDPLERELGKVKKHKKIVMIKYTKLKNNVDYTR